MTGSTVHPDFERRVVDWLDESAGTGAPDYLDETLARIDRVRQRPAWMSPGRWLPMRALTLNRFNVPRFVPVLLTLALLLVLAIVVAILVGSRNQKLPPPFGPAAPGWLVLDAGGDLVRISATGATAEPFATLPNRQFGATWSRDGQHVAYWSTDKSENATSTPGVLWIASGDGSNPRPVFGDRQFRVNELIPSVSWSPDSQRLAFSTTQGELYVVDAAGTNLTPLNGAVGRCCPAWSPDGSWIAFITGRTMGNVAVPFQQENVYVARTDGPGEERVSHGQVTLPGLDWSTDSRLTYTVGSNDIVVAARGSDGWTETVIVQGGGSENFFPRWSNASDRIAYVREDALWIANADGTDQRKVGTRDWVNVAWPCWSPDDRTIVALHTDTRGAFVQFAGTASVLFIDVATDEQIANVPVPKISGILACSWQRLAP